MHDVVRDIMKVYNLTPVWMHATPLHRSRQAPPAPSRISPVTKPASLIIWANAGCSGNFRIDSTRYWYESRSPARIVPSSGMTENEYWSYSLHMTRLSGMTCFKQETHSRVQDRICDSTKLKARKGPSRLQHSVGFPKGGRDVGEVADSKRHSVEIVLV
jgi:hypothetical protein